MKSIIFWSHMGIYLGVILVIIVLSSTTWHRFTSYLEERHPHRLDEFELPLTRHKPFKGLRIIITMLRRHQFEDPQLARLFRKTRGYYILLFSWLLLAFPFFVFATILDHVFKTAL